MKIPKEKVFIAIIGLLLLSYAIEAIVKPLRIQLTSPYAFLNPVYLSQYPLTAALVVIRGISLFLIPTLILSFIKGKHFSKVIFLLIVCSLSQLLSIQEIITDTTLVPLEWALSISFAGALLILPMITITLNGLFVTTKSKLKQANSIINDKIEVDE